MSTPVESGAPLPTSSEAAARAKTHLPWQLPDAAQSGGALLTVILVLLLGFRCYGNRFGFRPTEVAAPSISRKVDLNQADKVELEQLPGVGSNMADAIMNYRRDHGPFQDVDELGSIKGIGDKTIERLRPLLTASKCDELRKSPHRESLKLERTPPAREGTPLSSAKVQTGETLKVNQATEAELTRLPGVGPALAKRIIAARDAKPFASIDDLRRVKGIGPKTLESLRPFVRVD